MHHLKNINLHYEYYDDGCAEGAPVVLMLPGVSCGAGIFRESIPHFLPKFKVLLFNNPGLNGISMPVWLTVEKIVERVKQVVDHLGLKKVHVVGHSMGGFSAQRFCLTYPKMVEKVVFCSTSFGGPHSQIHVDGIVEEGFNLAFNKNRGSIKEDPVSGCKFVFSPTFVKNNPAEYRRIAYHYTDISSSISVTVRHFACASLFDSYGEIHELNKEVLVIHGKDDKLVRPDGGELLARQIKNARILRLKDCGHMPMYEREDFYPSIVNFLNGEVVGERAEDDEAGTPVSTLNHVKKTYTPALKHILKMRKRK